MDQARFMRGDKVRREVLGSEYVDRANKSADDFNQPLANYSTEMCWGEVWANEDLPRKTRSFLNIAMLSILNRPTELKTHLRGALRNGATKAELRAVLMQVAVYAGLPIAVDSFRVAREVLNEHKE